MSPSPRLALAPSISFGGYWTFTTAAILVLLILFLAGNGLLTQWLNLFVYSAPTSVQPASAAAPTIATAQAQQTSGASPATVLGTIGKAAVNPGSLPGFNPSSFAW